MPLIEWSDSLSVKIAEIDVQHQQLIGMINELHDAMKSGKAQYSLGNILTRLAYYAETHFATEERYFTEYEYPKAASHVAEHRKFLEQVQHYDQELTAGRIMLSMEIMKFLGDWLVHHIQGVDMQYSGYFLEKGAA
jgi:hemerythrin